MSGSAGADAERGVNKVRVKRQIRNIVEDLENILGDLKDVAKELKEVVQEIDCLTSDLHLEEELTDGSKTDTLNSSSSSTTASSVKIYPEETPFRSAPAGVLTVLKRAVPPAPPPRSAPARAPELNGDTSKGRCAPSSRERVRFSEKVQYHGYCPDCDLQYDVSHTDLHLHAELMEPRPSPVHQCTALVENGLACPLQKPQKTILRKSTSTTV